MIFCSRVDGVVLCCNSNHFCNYGNVGACGLLKEIALIAARGMRRDFIILRYDNIYFWYWKKYFVN